MRKVNWLSPAFPIVAIVLSLWPVWVWYLRRMTDGSDEPLGVIALIAGGILLWRNREEVALTKPGMIAAGGCLAIYAVGFPFFPPLIRAVLAIVAIACLSGSVLKRPGLWCLFLLSLPVVASLQFYLGYPMRWFSAAMADGILSLVGLDVARQGTELILNGNTPVGVDPPCSGVRMLWTGAFISALICAVGGYSWFRTAIFMLCGCFAVVLANGFRVTLLFVKESGLLDLPEWTHEGIGLLVFLLLVLALRKGAELGNAGVLEPNVPAERRCAVFGGRRVRIAFLLVSLLLAVQPVMQDRVMASQDRAQHFPGWPEEWQGHFLEPLRLSESEESFASAFPGEIAVFRAGNSKVIFRWVTRPTRLLHSSADCLRAEGYEIATERAGRFIATDSASGNRYWVEETIFNDSDSWAEVSTWFWSATFQRTTGPWWAVTTIQPAM